MRIQRREYATTTQRVAYATSSQRDENTAYRLRTWSVA